MDRDSHLERRKNMADAPWSLKGEYFESCNCEILCPCIVQGTGARPTEGHCDVALAFHAVRVAIVLL
jgi:hypothetical protein